AVRRWVRGVFLPKGYTRELGGQIAGQEATLRALLAVMGFGALAVLVVLLAQFRRARLAPLVVASVPLAVVGALATLWAASVPLHASSLVGGGLLGGRVVRNGILLLGQAEGLMDG